tara:strand:+ start:3533 stop:5020 length:1488 start_codon:yes stop_codon:yes gene_type:complete
MRKLTTVLLLLAGLCCLLEGCGTPEKTWTDFQKEWEARGEKFDYRVFVPAPIPSEKNFAHTPLLKALFEEEWNSELTESKPVDPKRHEQAGELLKIEEDLPAIILWPRGQRVDLAAFQDVFRKEGSWPHPAKPGKPAEDVLKALEVFADEMAELSRAARERPLCRFDIKYEAHFAASMPHLMVLRNLTRCFTLRAVANLEAGKLEAAFADVEMGLFLTESQAAEPLALSQLVRISNLEMILQAIWEGFATGKWTPAQLVTLEKHLAGIDLVESCRRALRCERDMANQFIHQVREDADYQKTQELVDLAPHWPGIDPIGWLDRNQLRFNELYMKFNRRIIDTRTRTIKPSVAAEQLKYIEENKRKPDHVISSLIVLSIGPLVRQFGNSQAAVDQALLACRLERHKFKKGAYPAKLDELEGTQPTDPYSGGSYLYRASPESEGTGRYQLYGIGWNLKDDSGKIVINEWGQADNEKGDLVWSYSHPPALFEIPKPGEK